MVILFSFSPICMINISVLIESILHAPLGLQDVFA